MSVYESALSSSGSDRISRQVVLPMGKSLQIAFKSIQVRFFRSLITTMSLVLAVSFLCFVRVSNDVANGFLDSNIPELRELLVRSGYDLKPTDASVGSSPIQRWIVILSLLVCVVGIVNAQLMAVTERFREIGTMKCLGALDRFVLRLFLLEAAMQGVAGATVGGIVGAVFSLINSLIRYGNVAIIEVSGLDVLYTILYSICVGCLLSLLGVLYPALLASKMQPVEAMRVEQ